MLTEDLTPFFNTAEFARPAIWSQQPAQAINVIFDAGFADPLGISSSNPTATAIQAQMPAVARGQTLQIGGVTYSIDDIQPDGTGLLVLPLKKA